MRYFEISEAWAKACGIKGTRIFKVLSVKDMPVFAPNWCAQLLTVERDGHEWQVFIGRGRYIE